MGRACVHCKRLLPTIARLNLLLFSLRLKKHPGLARDPARNPAEACCETVFYYYCSCSCPKLREKRVDPSRVHVAV